MSPYSGASHRQSDVIEKHGKAENIRALRIPGRYPRVRVGNLVVKGDINEVRQVDGMAQYYQLQERDHREMEIQTI